MHYSDTQMHMHIIYIYIHILCAFASVCHCEVCNAFVHNIFLTSTFGMYIPFQILSSISIRSGGQLNVENHHAVVSTFFGSQLNSIPEQLFYFS